MPTSLDWTRDELTLALELYFRCPQAQGNKAHPEIKSLSEELRALPIYPQALRNESFRNPNGVYMKLMNFRAYDPTRPGVGLQQGGRLESEIWERYSGNPDVLVAAAKLIRDSASELAPVVDLDELNLPEVKEGGIVYRAHHRRERNATIIEKKKKTVLDQEKALRCEVCAFDFSTVYGVLGDEFAECHHNTPLATMTADQTTKLSDLSIVCANCHRMLHRRGQLLSVEQLRTIVRENLQR